jgi:hypothetical protein
MPDLNITDEDMEFAVQIIEDFAEFEEGITDVEKMAQWVRNIRHAAERKQEAVK